MYNIRHIFIAALLVSTIGQISANPGAALILSQSGLDEAQNIAVPILQSQLNNIKVPDVHTKVRILKQQKILATNTYYRDLFID